MNYILSLNESELTVLKAALKEDAQQWRLLKEDYKLICGNSIAENLVEIADKQIQVTSKLLAKLNTLG